MSDLQAAQAQAIADYYQQPWTGRPSDIAKPGLVQELLSLIADGNYIETAIEACGISKQTFYTWKKRGEAGEEPYKLFADSLKRAEARAEADLVGNVKNASKLPQFWAAGMTLLERRHPERFGKRNEEGNSPRVVVQIGVKDSDVQVQVSAQPFASAPSLSPAEHNDLACANQSQVEILSPIISNYVNQAERAPATPEGPTRRAITTGDPTPPASARVRTVRRKQRAASVVGKEKKAVVDASE